MEEGGGCFEARRDEMRLYICVCVVFALSEVAAAQDLFQLECFVFVC